MAKDPKIIAYIEGERKKFFGFSVMNDQKVGQIQRVLIPAVPKYDPKFEITAPKLSLSVPDFKKMKMRDQSFLGRPKIGPDSYEPNKIQQGVLMQSTFKKE
jgi:hypothetical protein